MRHQRKKKVKCVLTLHEFILFSKVVVGDVRRVLIYFLNFLSEMSIKEILSYFFDVAKNYKYTFNPIYLYFTIIWSISKIVQIILNHEHSIWEICWTALLNTYGKKSTQH